MTTVLFPSLAIRRRAPQVVLLASALGLWSVSAVAQAPPERLSDDAVKALIDQVDTGRDKFEGNLDGAFKGSTVKGPNGDLRVEGALQDYQDNTKKLQSRFTPEYPAGPEVVTVLKQATAIDRFMKNQPVTMKGRPEWDRHAAELKLLAGAYGTTFPLPEDGVATRINDKEPLAAAAAIAGGAGKFKDELDKVTTLPKADKDATKKDVDLLIKQANTVKERIGGGKPVLTDVQLLSEHVTKLDALVASKQIPTTNWPAVRASSARLQEIFGLKKAPAGTQ